MPASSSSCFRPAGASSTSDSGGCSATSRWSGVAAAGEVQHHDVVFRVDDRADLVQRLAQVGHGREGHGQQRLRIVDQHHRASVGPPAAVHRRLRGLRIVAIRAGPAVGREADEIEVGLPGRSSSRFSSTWFKRNACAASTGFGAGVELPDAGSASDAPRHHGSLVISALPNQIGAASSRPAADRAQPAERRHRRERDRDAPDQHDHDPATRSRTRRADAPRRTSCPAERRSGR